MPIQAIQYKIRHLKRHEIEQLLQLCKAEGRHMGTVAEVESWMQIDPNGFFVVVNEKDRIIGSCVAMCLSETHGYIGMYVVNKDYRGLGIGKQVWQAAINHLGTRNQGLSAVAHLFTLYRDKAGFSNVADWTVDLYKLDYMDGIFHCNKHQIKRRKYDRKKSLPVTSNSVTYPLNGDISTGWLNKECVFCCLAHQYKSKERKYLKQKKQLSNRNIEFSDDESYGFSNLFFEDDNQNNESKENVIVEDGQKLSNKINYDRIQFESLEFLFKFRFCKCIRCHGGKMRTMVLNSTDVELIEKVVEYDQRLHQYDRSAIVRLTMIEKNCISRIAMLGQVIVGYGCVKPSLQNMWIMCPLYADNEYVARMLMIDLVSDLILVTQSSFEDIIPSVVLKAPSNNHHASILLKELGFIKQDYSLKRCYTKEVFEVPTQFIYALHTSVFCTE